MSDSFARNQRGCTDPRKFSRTLLPADMDIRASPSWTAKKVPTLSNFLCQYTSNSRPAASIQQSTALVSSSLILRRNSSALGDFLSKYSEASNKIADGDVEPGRNMSCEDSVGYGGKWWICEYGGFIIRRHNLRGTICRNSQSSLLRIRVPSNSPTRNTGSG